MWEAPLYELAELADYGCDQRVIAPGSVPPLTLLHTQIHTHTCTLVSTQAHTADRGVSWPGAKTGVKRSTVHFLGARALAIQLIIQSLCPRCCNRLGREAVNNLNVALTFTQPAEQEVLNTCE